MQIYTTLKAVDLKPGLYGFRISTLSDEDRGIAGGDLTTYRGVLDYELNDTTQDRIRVYTSQGIKTVAFTDDVLETVQELPLLDAAGDVVNSTQNRNKLMIQDNKIYDNHINTDGLSLDVLAPDVTSNTAIHYLIVGEYNSSKQRGVLNKLDYYVQDASGSIPAIFFVRRNGEESLIRGVADPQIDIDAANKRYVDSMAMGLRDFKDSCKYATKNDISSYWNDTTTKFEHVPVADIDFDDGVDYSQVVDERILVHDNSEARTNGIFKIT